MADAYPSFPLDRNFADAANTMLDVMLSAQDMYIGAIETAADALKQPVKWPETSELTGAGNVFAGFSEDRMREMFHQLANANLRGWEHAANVLQATPEWMRWPHATTGALMTDWFDKLNRNGYSDTATTPMSVERMPFAESAPEPKQADDLTAIKGIGPKMSAALIEAGVTRFEDIAGWSGSEVSAMEKILGSKGRITRQKWVAQAKKLAKAAK